MRTMWFESMAQSTDVAGRYRLPQIAQSALDLRSRAVSMLLEQRTVAVSLSLVHCHGHAARGELRCFWFAWDILTGNLSWVGEFRGRPRAGREARSARFRGLGFGCCFGD